MNFKDSNPIYLQIAQYIIDKIIMNEWKQGERIISVRELASEIEVNPNTIARTYTYLSDLGLIFNKRGVGYFISEDAYEISRRSRENEFLQNELPQLFSKMELLHIDIEKIKQLYEEYRNNKE